MKKLRDEIQFKYFDIYDELLDKKLIQGKLNADMLGLARDQENEIWGAELRLLDDIKNDFDVAIAMIESGEAEKAMNDAGNF